VSKVVNGVHTFNFSVDAKQDIHFQDMYKIIATTKVNTVLSTLEYRTELFSRFLINSGLSYNFTKPIYTSSGEIPLRDLSAMNCQLSCAYVLPDNLQMIHLGYSRTTIFPRIRDLFGNDLRAGYVPNPDLKEEMNNNLDFGINSSFVNNNLGVSFSLFYNPVRDLLVDVALTDTTSQTQNLNSAIFYGSEVMIKYAPNENVFATLSYTYLKATNNSGNRTSDYIAYRPEHFLRMFLSYTPVRYIGVNCSFVFCSRQYYDSSTRWLSIPDYTLLDVGLQSKPIDHATLWFKVNNLFDRNYFSVFDQPQPGREFRVGFSVDFVTD
jgi:outer membrane receptor protein involved in Fe transport